MRTIAARIAATTTISITPNPPARVSPPSPRGALPVIRAGRVRWPAAPPRPSRPGGFCPIASRAGASRLEDVVTAARARSGDRQHQVVLLTGHVRVGVAERAPRHGAGRKRVRVRCAREVPVRAVFRVPDGAVAAARARDALGQVARPLERTPLLAEHPGLVPRGRLPGL